MILGRGSAQTDAAIIAEYQNFLEMSRDKASIEVHKSLCRTPFMIHRFIGKPICAWSDEDLITLYRSRSKESIHRYNCFVSFLVFRGYLHPSLNLLVTLSINFSKWHRHALLPIRQKIQEATKELDYNNRETGMIVNLLTWILARTHKPLEELTRADFDGFREEYQQWYRTRRADGSHNPRLTRVEYYLIHWGVIPRARCAVSHDEYFSQLHHETIKKAIRTFVAWCQVKYQPASVNTYRAGLLFFFLWLQEQYPTYTCLDDVTRKEALAYAEHLQRRKAGGLSRIYCNNLYHCVRIFFDFAITELLDTAPLRNPFMIRDVPPLEEPLPRYLADHEVRTILEYCDHEASLRERTIVIVLLHTGIRIAELMALQTSDIVQIQGRWKVHIREGKGLKDRLIPLTEKALAVLQIWQEQGWEGKSPYIHQVKQEAALSGMILSVEAQIIVKEPLMSSIPQVSRALQTVFTTVATTAAQTTGFIRRQRQLTGAGFVQALVFGFLAHPAATLEQLTHSAANVGMTISPQGLEQRFTEAAATCLQRVVAAAVQQVITAKPVAIPILQRFTGVYVLDSTTITLPDVLASVWQGCGGSTPGTAAALKIQVLWNLTTGAFEHLALQDGRASDQRAPVQNVILPPGALRIADLGYFALDQIAWLRRQGSYVLSRWYPHTQIFDLTGRPLLLVDLLRQEAHPTLDQTVLLGAKHRIPVRLLALRVPQEVADQRRRRIREEARSKGRAVSAHLLVLADWTICVTTVPPEDLSVTEALVLMRVRWQVELLFKLWKSHGQMDTSRSAQPWRVLCEVYAKLLSLLVVHWVVLVSCWQDVQRSLPKIAQLVQSHAFMLGMVVMKSASQIAARLRHIVGCMGGGGRMNARKKRPNTYQLLLALGEGALT